MLAADLRASDVGARVAFATGPMVRGVLEGVHAYAAEGLTVHVGLTVGGVEYLLDTDALVHVDEEHLLRILDQPGRAGVLERANHVATMHLAVSALVPRRPSDGWDDVAAPWEA